MTEYMGEAGVNGGPPSTVGINAVLHLIPDDIYLSVRFTLTSTGSGGGFSYIRSTPLNVPEPSVASLLRGGSTVVAENDSSQTSAR
jgi:hypothetical protein